jgi:UDP-N-acetylglucosamine diphosphorylase / glucose-1-phosphate thymidylyltransferase / UDP-N-acetylgalactosamine diphosphorylase / glucosamine-1-phosphate N-acetyltransferase / galactosamine-1-phosphate N-acetyltransferase
MSPRPGVVCYDDAIARRFEPFALTRPFSEMRVGALLVRERWTTATGRTARGLLAAPGMRDFHEPGAPRMLRRAVPAGTLIVNARCAVSLQPLDVEAADVLRCEERVAAVRLSADEPVDTFAEGSITLEALARRHHGRRRGSVITGRWCDEVWDVIRWLAPLLSDDLPVLASRLGCASVERTEAGPVVIGPGSVWAEAGAHIEPQTVFDTTSGPVLLRRDARVQAFSRVQGPCYVGVGTTISGGKVGGSALGDTCKVNGELSASVFVGHANKGHDGFVGHSVLGRWVNLGAGTTTSNLKNTYGPVALWTPEGVRDTGLQFLGTLFGDHVKTGIGLRLTTGCVLGAGANVVDRMPPKVVAPFSWGSGAPYGTYEADKFLETAARVMARRDVALDAAGARHLRSAFARRWSVG